jgi:hypothetical protein
MLGDIVKRQSEDGFPYNVRETPCKCKFTNLVQPLDAPSLTKWRKRVGADKLSEMLQQTIAIAVNDKQGVTSKCCVQREFFRRRFRYEL